MVHALDEAAADKKSVPDTGTPVTPASGIRTEKKTEKKTEKCTQTIHITHAYKAHT